MALCHQYGVVSLTGYIVHSSPRVTGLSHDTFFGYTLPFTVTTCAYHFFPYFDSFFNTLLLPSLKMPLSSSYLSKSHISYASSCRRTSGLLANGLGTRLSHLEGKAPSSGSRMSKSMPSRRKLVDGDGRSGLGTPSYAWCLCEVRFCYCLGLVQDT